jgi:hypothetical protein
MHLTRAAWHENEKYLSFLLALAKKIRDDRIKFHACCGGGFLAVAE